jgi:hypothetical protein
LRSKLYTGPAAALNGLLFDGMTVMSGGFGLSGNPESLIPEVRRRGVKNLTAISNNAGAEGFGLWMLLDSRQVRKMISSYVGENKLFEQQYLSGQLELELNPQGKGAFDLGDETGNAEDALEGGLEFNKPPPDTQTPNQTKEERAKRAARQRRANREQLIYAVTREARGETAPREPRATDLCRHRSLRSDCGKSGR